MVNFLLYFRVGDNSTTIYDLCRLIFLIQSFAMRFELQLCTALTLATSLSLAARFLSAQIITGKKISCGVSGLQGFGDPCGFQYYDAAFVGRIISLEELPADEFRLVVSPKEVFKGDLAATVTLTRRSGACMPEICNRAGMAFLGLFGADRIIPPAMPMAGYRKPNPQNAIFPINRQFMK